MVKPPNQGKRDAWDAIDGGEGVPFGSPGCKWPLKHRDEDGIFKACGEKKDAAEPYCEVHMKLGNSPRVTKAKGKANPAY